MEFVEVRDATRERSIEFPAAHASVRSNQNDRASVGSAVPPSQQTTQRPLEIGINLHPAFWLYGSRDGAVVETGWTDPAEQTVLCRVPAPAEVYSTPLCQ
jgi:hypothetical protein